MRNLDDSELYLNREISWLSFNERVLSEAENIKIPLMERLKFCTIFSSNLDEFFMVRLSGLLRLASAYEESMLFTSLESEETLDEVALKVRSLVKRIEKCLYTSILPELAKHNITIINSKDLTRSEEEKLETYFENQVFPVLTPLAIDPAHPFPYLSNLSLYLAVTFEETSENGSPLLALVEIPSKITRIISVPNKKSKNRFILVENLIQKFLHKLFPWTRVTASSTFRVTRNLDYKLLDTEVKDLMQSVEFELKDREQKIVVRLEYEKTTPTWLVSKLAVELGLEHSDLYEIEGMLNYRDLAVLLSTEKNKAILRDKPFNPRLHPSLVNDEKDLFEIIKERDILLHHPYESFASVLDFLQSTAKDPNVIAIKQTLYRSGGDSPIIDTLVQAAEQGKQVTVVVELKARFDEANNIEWARRLERAGAHVVFGFIELKTHAKCTLIIRKEKDNSLLKFVHLSTGNYNSTTAKFYTDIGYLTSDPAICDDIANLFNFLTGFNVLKEENINNFRPPVFEKILVAPFRLREQIIQLIEHEKKLHSKINPAHIILKMNALVDEKLCHALYRASQKGVKIDLIVRGVCVLRPGMPGISENIRVVSIIDRFLEHSRIFWFKNGNEPIVYCGSADFMPRNMERRVEVLWPINSKDHKEKLLSILNTVLNDNCKSHVMQNDGSYVQNHPKDNEKPFRCQEKFIEQARIFGIKSVEYEQAIKLLSNKKANEETRQQKARKKKK